MIGITGLRDFTVADTDGFGVGLRESLANTLACIRGAAAGSAISMAHGSRSGDSGWIGQHASKTGVADR
jgi:hypothetical protein